VSPDEWAAFVKRFRELAGDADVVVLSGSLPPGAPIDGYATLIELSGAARTILDTSGEALRHGLAAGPDLAKPNAAELAAALAGAARPDALRNAHAARTLGARAVAVSNGPDGLLAATEEGAWRSRPPYPVAGNPTGAGDACVAALARGLAAGTPWPALLTDAVALSAAAVAADVAGAVDLDLYRRIGHDVITEEL
jgi:tagatose 6-phosphate kinase